MIGPEHDIALATHSYYVGELAAGRRACERLLARPDLSQEVEHMVRANRTWYTPKLEELVACRHQRIDIEPAHEGWSLFNPTVLVHGDLIAIVRSSNYRIVDGRYEMPASDGGQIRSRNILVRFYDDLRVASARVLSDPDYPQTGYPVTGLEDCRLRHTKTGIGVSATVRDVSPFDGRCRIATADIDIQAGRLANLLVLDGINQTDEKNWMPFLGERGGWLYATSHNGHTVTVDANGAIPGSWQMAQRQAAPALSRGFRGGSQLVPLGIGLGFGWLGLVHEVAIVGERRVYEHRFIWLDERLALARVSPAFAFRESQTIEFAAGLAVIGNYPHQRLVASYGVRDAEAWLCEIDLSAMEGLLNAVTV
jgi:hypothetical protein